VVPSAVHLKFEIYLDTMFRFLTFHSYQNLRNHINSNTMLSRPSTKAQNLPTKKRGNPTTPSKWRGGLLAQVKTCLLPQAETCAVGGNRPPQRSHPLNF